MSATANRKNAICPTSGRHHPKTQYSTEGSGLKYKNCCGLRGGGSDAKG